MKIKLWGTRGSIPSPGPETIRYGGKTPFVGATPSHGSLPEHCPLTIQPWWVVGRRKHTEEYMT